MKELTNERKLLLEKLIDWRGNTAERMDVPKFFIFHNSVLEEITNKMPSTKEELREIKGIGEKKVISYGNEVLEIINGSGKNPSTKNFQYTEPIMPKENPPKDNVFTVKDLTRYIKNILESDKKLNNLYVKGEISNLREYFSGHTYFNLKDEKSQINCVLFQRKKEKIKFELEEGMKVILKGDINVYEPKGEYSLIVEEIQPEGFGSLHLAFIQLKKKLEKEGLFLKKYKKELPKFPEVVGVVTSLAGAALQDILKVIKKRYPIVKVIAVSTLVQGKESASSIVESLDILNKRSDVDVIILGRGGGSIEDLWSFNEEIVARAIFNSGIPIISAVGHETDFTIADFVADERSPTPSTAAERAVPNIREIFDQIGHLKIRSKKAIYYKLELYKSNLKQINKSAIFKIIMEVINSRDRELDQTKDQLKESLKELLRIRKKDLEIAESKIITLNPLSILKRGYSVVMSKNKILTNFSSVKKGEDINIILHKGKIGAKVEKTWEK